jgi:putative FmdB family regulatory protein
MPTYEYLCSKCGHQFEKFQSMKDNTLSICPEDACGKKRWGKGKVKRVMGAGAGLIFKGSGFYITDYRSENYKQGAKKDSPVSDSKPAVSTPAAEKKTTAPAKAESKSSKAS